MSGTETARRRVVQRRIGGAEMALPRINVPDPANSVFHSFPMIDVYHLSVLVAKWFTSP